MLLVLETMTYYSRYRLEIGLGPLQKDGFLWGSEITPRPTPAIIRPIWPHSDSTEAMRSVLPPAGWTSARGEGRDGPV